MLANGNDTRQIMETFGNLTSNQEVGLVAPESFDWFIVFEFDPVGYVKDDDKDDLDADGMLKSIREGTEYANEQREKMGVPPHEDPRLETQPALQRTDQTS